MAFFSSCVSVLHSISDAADTRSVSLSFEIISGVYFSHDPIFSPLVLEVLSNASVTFHFTVCIVSIAPSATTPVSNVDLIACLVDSTAFLAPLRSYTSLPTRTPALSVLDTPVASLTLPTALPVTSKAFFTHFAGS
jgi:hypothetical protein